MIKRNFRLFLDGEELEEIAGILCQIVIEYGHHMIHLELDPNYIEFTCFFEKGELF